MDGPRIIGGFKPHADTWVEVDDAGKKIQHKYSYTADGGKLRDLPENIVNVIGSRRSIKAYHTAIIGDIEYIRPFTMRLHDNFLCEQLSEDDADALQTCHEYYIGNAEVDLALIKSHSARFGVGVLERFIKEGNETNQKEIRHSQMAAIYNGILKELYEEYFHEPYFAIEKIAPGSGDDEDDLFKLSMVTVTKQLLKIGELLKDYSYNQICNFDRWTDNQENKKNKDIVRQAVMEFVNRYGLLGILNNLFCTLDVLSSNIRFNSYHIKQLEVKTCLNRIQSEVNAMKAGYDIAVYGGAFRFEGSSPDLLMQTRLAEVDISLPDNINGLSKIMRTMEYIRLFFPTDNFMIDYDTYAQTGDQYWVKYSEPMYLFLLQSKLYYDKLNYTAAMVKSDKTRQLESATKLSVKKSDAKLSKLVLGNYLSFIEPLNAKVLFNYGETNLGVREVFYNLIDTISYYTYLSLSRGKLHVIVCPYCKRVTTVENPRSLYCGNSCQTSAKSYRTRQKIKAQIESNTDEQ